MPESTRLRTAARITLAIGAVAAEALMLIAGRANRHYTITALFVVWDGAQFALLCAGDWRSTRWPPPVRTTLYWLMLVTSAATVVVYVNRLINPPAAQPAFVFVLVPPVVWMVTAVAIGVAFAAVPRVRR